jgi:hypothetical protein
MKIAKTNLWRFIGSFFISLGVGKGKEKKKKVPSIKSSAAIATGKPTSLDMTVGPLANSSP